MNYSGRCRTLLFLIITLISMLVLFSGCATTAAVPASEAAGVWYNLGNAYNELGRHEDAVVAYTMARELEPELFSAGYNLARIYIYLKKYDESSSLLDELLAADPGNRIAAETKAWVCHLQGDDDSALVLYDNILQESPASRNALYNSAMILIGREEAAEALSRLLSLVEYFPDEKTVFFNLAALEAELGREDNAIGWIKKQLAEVSDDFKSIELLGDIYSSQRRFGEAVSEYDRALSFVKESENEQGNSSAVKGRLNFKKAEILLVYIEDEAAGLEALREVKAAKWSSREDFGRLLSNTGYSWIEKAVEILEYHPEAEVPDIPGAVEKTDAEEVL